MWKSHGKGITISELTALKLRIEDFSGDADLRPLIRDYYNTMDEYVRMRNHCCPLKIAKRSLK